MAKKENLLRSSSYKEALAQQAGSISAVQAVVGGDKPAAAPFANLGPKGKEGTEEDKTVDRIQVDHGWLSSLILGWLWPVIVTGWNRPLTTEDIPELKPRMQAKVVGDKVSTIMCGDFFFLFFLTLEKLKKQRPAAAAVLLRSTRVNHVSHPFFCSDSHTQVR